MIKLSIALLLTLASVTLFAAEPEAPATHAEQVEVLCTQYATIAQSVMHARHTSELSDEELKAVVLKSLAPGDPIDVDTSRVALQVLQGVFLVPKKTELLDQRETELVVFDAVMEECRAGRIDPLINAVRAADPQ